MASLQSALSIPKIIEVVCASGYNKGSSVKVINRRTGEVMVTDIQQRKLKLNQNKKCVVVLDDMANAWAANDVIEIVVTGLKYGSTTVTLNASATKQSTSEIAAGSMTPPAWSI